MNVPSGPLSLHLVRAPPVARPAPCVPGTLHTEDESEENTLQIFTFEQNQNDSLLQNNCEDLRDGPFYL